MPARASKPKLWRMPGVCSAFVQRLSGVCLAFVWRWRALAGAGKRLQNRSGLST